MVRPSFWPCITLPLIWYGRPSKVAARCRSPAARVSRTRVLEARSPATSTDGIASVTKSGQALSSSKLPLRSAPNWKSSPISR
ncbi:hypothetical protein D3C71_1907300 [compost metagenome]